MKKIYLLIICLFAGFLSIALPVIFQNVQLLIVSKSKIIAPNNEKPKPKAIAKKPKVNENRAKILYTLVPSLTAVQSADVANTTPGGTINYSVLLSNSAIVGAGNDATGVNFNNILNADLTLVPGSVKATPIAANDAYDCIGNVGINVNTNAGGVMNNDISPDGTALSGVSVLTNVTHGTLNLNTTNGQFTYTPTAGYLGTDSFVYTLTSANGTSGNGTVTITITTPIWFVNIGTPSNGTGTIQSPFKDWSNFATANALSGASDPTTNQTIFVYSGAYSGAATLKSGQKVLGEGASVTLASFAGAAVPSFSNILPNTSGAKPNLTSSGATITLNANNTLRGFDMGTVGVPGSTSSTDITGSSFGTLTASEIALGGDGRALNLSSGALSATFTSISSTNSLAEGLLLSSVLGSLTSTGGTTITNPTTDGIAILSSSSVNANFGNTNITGSGGTGLITTTSSNIATLTFADLDIAPDAGKPAINIGSSNTVICSSGTITTSNTVADVPGILISGTSTASKASLTMVLDSYSSTGNAGSNKALRLNNTSGSFTINGIGTTAGSGGTISTFNNRGFEFIEASNIVLKNMNFTNSSISTTACSTPTADNSNCNAAIHAKTVTGLTLSNISITGNTKNMGVNLNDVTAFSLANSTIIAVGGATGISGNDAGGVFALNLKGTCSITNSYVNDSNGRNFYCENNSNQTMSLTVTGSQFKNTFGKSVGGANFMFRGFGSSNNTVVLKTNDFSNPRTYGLHISATGTSINTIQVGGSTAIEGNTIVAAASSPGSNAFALQSGIAHSGSINYNVLNNNFQTSFNGGDGFNIGGQGTAAMQGRCNNNTSSAVNTAGSNGILIAQYGNGTHRAEVHNNTITGVNNNGISIDSRDNGVSGSNGRVDASVLNNSISLTSAGYSHVNVTAYADAGSTSTMKSCIKVGGNTSIGGANVIANFDVVSTPSPNQVILQGATTYIVPGTVSRTANLTNFWKANNGNVGTAIDESGEGAFGGPSPIGSIIAGTCLSPTNPAALRMIAQNIEEKETQSIEKAEIIKEETTAESEEKTKTALTTDGIAEIIDEKISEETDEQPKTEIKSVENYLSESRADKNINIDAQNSVASPQSGETITINGTGSGFTIPAGKSTTISFGASVSATPSSCTIPNVGTVSGSNFATFNTNTVNTTVIVAIPTAIVPAAGIGVCQGSTTSLSATAVSGATLTWYTPGNVVAGTGSPLIVTPAGTGAYSVTNKLGGCESAKAPTGIITIKPLPDGTITGPNPVCQNSTFNVSVPGGAATYLWTGEGIANPNVNTISVTPQYIGAHNYYVRITGTNGCESGASKLVNVVATPKVSLVVSSSICKGSTATLTANCLYNVSAILSGDAQVPAVATNGSGFASGTFNPITNELILNVTYSNVGSNVTMAHIHGPAAAGVNAGVLQGFSGVPSTTSGSFSYTGIIGFASALLAGNTYVNIHTVINGGGELRGQLSITDCANTTYSWSPGGLAGQTINVSPLINTNYIVTASQNSCTSTANTTVNVTPVTLPATYGPTVKTQDVATNLFATNCEYLAKVVPGVGLSGNVTVKEWLETTPPFLYVPRHYEITPATNAAGAAGIITLYFTQADFNAYNGTISSGKIPTSTGDVAGIPNFQILKYAGTSPTGLNYGGSPTLIPGAGNSWNTTSGYTMAYNISLQAWEVTFPVTSFSGFLANSVSQPLPVQLISFKADKTTENKVAITWQTASEINADKFEIQRSIDAVSFQNIGVVKATGTTKESINYQYLDENPANGLNYYRLVEHDIDGKKQTSKIVAVQLDLLLAELFPNPIVGNKFFVKISGEKNPEFAVIDMKGKTVQTQFTKKSEGINEGVFLNKMPAGTYILTIKTANDKKQLKMIVE